MFQQASLVFSTPVFAAGFGGLSAYVHNWVTDVHERASRALATTVRAR